MAQTLRLIGLGDAADVLLKGVEAQACAGGDKGLLGDVEAGIELAGQLPGQGIEDGDQVASFRRVR